MLPKNPCKDPVFVYIHCLSHVSKWYQAKFGPASPCSCIVFRFDSKSFSSLVLQAESCVFARLCISPSHSQDVRGITFPIGCRVRDLQRFLIPQLHLFASILINCSWLCHWNLRAKAGYHIHHILTRWMTSLQSSSCLIPGAISGRLKAEAPKLTTTAQGPTIWHSRCENAENARLGLRQPLFASRPIQASSLRSANLKLPIRRRSKARILFKLGGRINMLAWKQVFQAYFHLPFPRFKDLVCLSHMARKNTVPVFSFVSCDSSSAVAACICLSGLNEIRMIRRSSVVCEGEKNIF